MKKNSFIMIVLEGLFQGNLNLKKSMVSQSKKNIVLDFKFLSYIYDATDFFIHST